MATAKSSSTPLRRSRTMRHRPKATRPRPPHGGRAAHASPAEGPPLIFGIHAVEAALPTPTAVIAKLYLTDNAERRLHEALTERQMAHERVLPRDLDRRLGPDTVHQGALLETEPLPEPTLAELAERAAGRPLIVLDQVTDPHNVGAILRSAAVFGAGRPRHDAPSQPAARRRARQVGLGRARARARRAGAEPRPRARRIEGARLHRDRPRRWRRRARSRR